MRRTPYTRAHERRRRLVRPSGPRIDWRNLPPLPPDEVVAIPRMPSQTLLKHWDRCHRAAHLYLRHRGGVGGHQLNRGTIFHDTVERLVAGHVIEQGNREIPPDVGKVELQAVLAERPELVVSAEERDYLRMLVYHWCLGSYFDPATVIGVEETLTLQLGEWTIRGRVDLIEAPDPGLLVITDYKTQRNMPDRFSWKRGGVDEKSGLPRFGGNFQTQVYAVLVAFGRDANGMQIGEGIDRWRLTLRFPAILWEEGIGYLEADVHRVQLADFRDDLILQLNALAEAERTGKFQPVPGSHCDECPAEFECPLPQHLRPESQGAAINTLAEAERLAASWRFTGRRNAKLKAAIKAAQERNGWETVRTGADTGFVFKPVQRESLKRGALPRLRSDVEGAAQYGHGLADDGSFPIEQYVTNTQGTEHREVKVGPKTDDERTDE